MADEYTQVDTEDFNELIIALGIAEISPEKIVGNMRRMINNPVKEGIGVKTTEWNNLADWLERGMGRPRRLQSRLKPLLSKAMTEQTKAEAKAEIEAHIAARVAGRNPLTDSEQGDAVIMTCEWTPIYGGRQHEGVGITGAETLAGEHSQAAIILTDAVAPSGIHYRSIDIHAIHQSGVQLHVILNGLPIRLHWNGHSSISDELSEYHSDLSADDVSRLRG